MREKNVSLDILKAERTGTAQSGIVTSEMLPLVSIGEALPENFELFIQSFRHTRGTTATARAWRSGGVTTGTSAARPASCPAGSGPTLLTWVSRLSYQRAATTMVAGRRSHCTWAANGRSRGKCVLGGPAAIKIMETMVK